MLEKKWGERTIDVQALSGPGSRHRCKVEDEITYLKHVVLWLQCRGFTAMSGCVIITTKAENPNMRCKILYISTRHNTTTPHEIT